MITRRLARERSHSEQWQQETWRTFHEQTEQLARGFGTLGLLNEVRLGSGAALPSESPHGGEVLTYVYEGVLAYQDDLGRSGTLHLGEFQCMTAGPRTRFNGANLSQTQTVHLFQMWLGPAPMGLEPKLEQHRFSVAERRNCLCPVVSPDARDQSVRTQQDAVVFSAILAKGRHVVHELHQGRCAWLHVIKGELVLADLVLEVGDGAGVVSERAVSITARSASEVLLLDLPESPALMVGEPEKDSVARLDDAAQAYPRMLLAIESARRTLHLEVCRRSTRCGSGAGSAPTLASRR